MGKGKVLQMAASERVQGAPLTLQAAPEGLYLRFPEMTLFTPWEEAKLALMMLPKTVRVKREAEKEWPEA